MHQHYTHLFFLFENTKCHLHYAEEYIYLYPTVSFYPQSPLSLVIYIILYTTRRCLEMSYERGERTKGIRMRPTNLASFQPRYYPWALFNTRAHTDTHNHSYIIYIHAYTIIYKHK